MEICSGRFTNEPHEEICYEGKKCPLCETMQEVVKLQKTIENLEDSLRQYE
jgi:transcription initiation factor IIE alpha subunit